MDKDLGVEPSYLTTKRQIWNKHLKNLTLPPSHSIISLTVTTIAQSFTNRKDKMSQIMPQKISEPTPTCLEPEVKLDFSTILTKKYHKKRSTQNNKYEIPKYDGNL